MNLYYFHDGETQLGPFNIQQLKDRNITRDDFVWKEGMNDWIKAGEVPELEAIFSMPPLFRSAGSDNLSKNFTDPGSNISLTEKNGRWIGRNFKWIALILVITTAGFVIYSKNSDAPPLPDIVTPEVKVKTPEEIRAELKLKEESNPPKYLQANLTHRQNFIDETVIEGYIYNSASVASFKNIVIEVSFLSKTDAVLEKKDITIYERVFPNQKQKIKKIKIYAPDQTKKLAVEVVGATVN